MKRTLLLGAALFVVLGAAAYGAESAFRQVSPQRFDPVHTHLVQSTWLEGIGCPTDASISTDGTTTTGYTDAACPTGDPKDKRNEGLLLAKTGPTGNFASAVAVLRDVPRHVTELGYDIRKPRSNDDPSGSHCGAGAPRFNIVTQDGTRYFVGCNSPPGTPAGVGVGWLRLRWGGSGEGAPPLLAFGPNGPTDVSTLDVRSISIVFDEGQDTGPDNFGLAVLDNIDVNGTLVGQGPNQGGGNDGGDNGND